MRLITRFYGMIQIRALLNNQNLCHTLIEPEIKSMTIILYMIATSSLQIHTIAVYIVYDVPCNREVLRILRFVAFCKTFLCEIWQRSIFWWQHWWAIMKVFSTTILLSTKLWNIFFSLNISHYCSLAKKGPLTKEHPLPTFDVSLITGLKWTGLDWTGLDSQKHQK